MLQERPGPTIAPCPPELSSVRSSSVTVLVLAGLFPVWALLRGLFMSLPVGRTDTLRYAARVGHKLVPAAAMATLVLIAVAAGIGWIRPDPSQAWAAGVVWP